MAKAVRESSGIDDRLPFDLVFQEYRRLYPKGRIRSDIETKGGWSRVDEGTYWRFRLIYWPRGKTDPFVLFEADLAKRTLDLQVLRAVDPAPIQQFGLQEKGEGWERYTRE